MDLANLIGRRLGGKYRVERFLARGGFGVVYVGVHEPLDRKVAIKVAHAAGDAELARRFLREARVQSALDHPGCVTIFDFGQEPDGLLYLVQQYLEGVSLREALDDEGTLDRTRAVAIALDVLDALAEAHRLGIIHRDIKPGNLMLVGSEPEVVRVLDWGIAKATTSHDLTDDRLTLGTPTYMAPEQARNAALGPATDLYALGVVLFEMLAGHPPFQARAPVDILQMHLTAPVPRLPIDAPGLQSVIDRAMEKAPQRRFSSAAEMSSALRAVVEAKPSPPMPLPAAIAWTPPGTRRLPAMGPPGGEPTDDPDPGPTAMGARAPRVSLPPTAALPRQPAAETRDAGVPPPIGAGRGTATRRSREARDRRWAALLTGGLVITMAAAWLGLSAEPEAIPVDAGRPFDAQPDTFHAPPDAWSADTGASLAAAPADNGPSTGRATDATADGAVPNDASPEPPRVRRVTPAHLRRRLARALDRCHCEQADRIVRQLAAMDPAQGVIAQREVMQACHVSLRTGTNCHDRRRH